MRYVSTFLTIRQAEQSTFQFYSLSDIYFLISTQTCIKQAASLYNTDSHYWQVSYSRNVLSVILSVQILPLVTVTWVTIIYTVMPGFL